MTDSQKKSKAIARRTGSIVERNGPRGVAYRIKFDVPGAAPNGQRKTIYKTVRGSRKDAERELARLVGQAEKGVELGGRQTVAAWVEAWLKDIRRHVSQRTFERYAELLRLHIVPRLGTTQMLQLRTRDVEACYNDLADSGRIAKVRKDGTTPAPTGLSAQTITHIHRVLFQCLNDAKRLQVIDQNPAENAKRIRRKKTAAANVDAVKMKILGRVELAQLIDGFRGARSKNVSAAMVLFALDTGARRGEFLAVQWRDINLEARTVRFDRALDETKVGGVQVKSDLKNESSRRTVSISSQTVAALSEEFRCQTAVQESLGRVLAQDAFVFHCDPRHPARPTDPDQVTKAFARIARGLGFTGLRLHDLRHNCASHMLAAGRPVPEVARHLGHSTPAITMQVYAHAIPQNTGGAGMLDDLLGSGPEATHLRAVG